MTSPSFDSTFGANSGHGSGSDITVETNNKTGGTNRVMVLAISYNYDGGNSGHVTGISDSLSALSWSFAGKVVDTTSGAFNTTIEIWTAPAAAVYNSGETSAIQTVTMSNTTGFDQYAGVLYAVEGCNSISSPFDSDGSLPASAFNSSSTTPPTVTFNTSQADDLLVAFNGRANSYGSSTPGGWSNQGSAGGGGGSNGATISCDFQSVSSTQSGATYTNAAGISDTSWVSIVMAFTADTTPIILDGAPGSYSISGTAAALIAAEPVSGTWGSTEAADTFAGTGSAVPPLSLDGYVSGGGGDSGSGITSASVNLTTSSGDDVICVLVTTGGFFHSGYVTEITDTAGLTWHRRQQRFAGGGASVELWWAHAPAALSGDTITVHTTTTGAIAIEAFGIAGTNYTTPFDTNLQAGWFTDNYNQGNPQSYQCTNANKAFLIAGFGGFTAEGGSVTSPFTYQGSVSESEHDGLTVYNSFGYTVVAVPQSGLVASFAAGSNGERGLLMDAVVANGEVGTSDAVLWFFDGTGTNGIQSLSGGGNSLALTGYTTYNQNILTVVEILIESAGGSGAVSSVTVSGIDSPGFVRRSRVTDGTGLLALEVWSAFSTEPVENATITIETENTANGDVVAALAFGIGGTTYAEAAAETEWDGSDSLPAYNHSNTGGEPNAADISTINPNTLDLLFTANITEQLNPVAPFTTTFPVIVGSFSNSSSGPNLNVQTSGPPTNLAAQFNFSSSVLSNATQEMSSSPEPEVWVAIGDAIPVGPPTPPTGVWGSTEAKDAMAAAGFVPAQAVWGSTERADYTTGAPATAPYDSIGWLGWVPAQATWASTDQKDVASFGAWVIGERLTGRWGSTEARDRAAFSNYSTVTGTWSSVEAPDRFASAGFEIPKVPPPRPRQRRMLIIT